MPSHRDEIERAFTTQADAFEDPRLNAVLTDDVGWIFGRHAFRGDERVLEVAAGTGIVAREVAPLVGSVVALDATAAMLDRGQRAAADAGVTNIEFQQGEAERLPFEDDSFDVVICRNALHHFEAPAVQVAEMGRCLRGGGVLVLSDLIVTSAEAGAGVDAIERLRDPSHTSILTVAALEDLARGAGREPFATARRETRRPLGPWVEQSATPPDALREIAALLERQDDAGVAPQRAADGEWTFVHRFASVLAR